MTQRIFPPEKKKKERAAREEEERGKKREREREREGGRQVENQDSVKSTFLPIQCGPEKRCHWWIKREHWLMFNF